MRTVVKTYKFKLYKSEKNKHLDDGINIAASFWNYCIAMHRHYYRAFGKHLSANRLKKHLTKVKRTLHPEWQALGSQAIQDVVERVDRSYKAFFGHVKQKRHGRKSPPSFKKRSRYSLLNRRGILSTLITMSPSWVGNTNIVNPAPWRGLSKRSL